MEIFKLKNRHIVIDIIDVSNKYPHIIFRYSLFYLMEKKKILYMFITVLSFSLWFYFLLLSAEQKCMEFTTRPRDWTQTVGDNNTYSLCHHPKTMAPFLELVLRFHSDSTDCMKQSDEIEDNFENYFLLLCTQKDRHAVMQCFKSNFT